MRSTYCSTCKCYHTPQSTDACRTYAANRGRPPGKFTTGSAVVVALLMGFAAGQVSNEGIVALGACLATLAVFGLGRLLKRRGAKS